MTATRLAFGIVLVFFATAPLLANLVGNAFYIDIATRLVCLTIAAVSLNLILGFGGMISFGHAAFLGIGAYCVGIPSFHATYGEFDLIASYNGLFHILLAVLVAASFALVTGAICLRTKGVHFIMITMAFSQMAFYFFVSMETYGGDDGLSIDVRSELPGINLDDAIELYYLCFTALVVAMFLVWRIVNSRFGMIIQGSKSNDERLRAIGVNPYPYRLTAYVISGAICGFAGALLGNFTTFISPEMMDWTRSGELMFMVILGGTGTFIGPAIGAVSFLMLEEILSSFTIYWHLPFGILLILIVLYMPGGLAGLLKRFEKSK